MIRIPSAYSVVMSSTLTLSDSGSSEKELEIIANVDIVGRKKSSKEECDLLLTFRYRESNCYRRTLNNDSCDQRCSESSKENAKNER